MSCRICCSGEAEPCEGCIDQARRLNWTLADLERHQRLEGSPGPYVDLFLNRSIEVGLLQAPTAEDLEELKLQRKGTCECGTPISDRNSSGSCFECYRREMVKAARAR